MKIELTQDQLHKMLNGEMAEVIAVAYDDSGDHIHCAAYMLRATVKVEHWHAWVHKPGKHGAVDFHRPIYMPPGVKPTGTRGDRYELFRCPSLDQTIEL